MRARGTALPKTNAACARRESPSSGSSPEPIEPATICFANATCLRLACNCSTPSIYCAAIRLLPPRFARVSPHPGRRIPGHQHRPNRAACAPGAGPSKCRRGRRQRTGDLPLSRRLVRELHHFSRALRPRSSWRSCRRLAICPAARRQLPVHAQRILRTAAQVVSFIDHSPLVPKKELLPHKPEGEKFALWNSRVRIGMKRAGLPPKSSACTQPGELAEVRRSLSHSWTSHGIGYRPRRTRHSVCDPQSLDYRPPTHT